MDPGARQRRPLRRGSLHNAGVAARPKLSPSSYAAEAYSYMRSAISAGRIAPGDLVPETRLARSLHVSRTPIREALRALVADGLVEAVHGAGFRVSRMSIAEIRAAYEMRELLEGFAAARAARLATPEDLWMIERTVVESKRADSRTLKASSSQMRRLTEANWTFHLLVAEASKNRFVARAIDQLSVRPLAYRALYWYSDRELRRSNSQHEAILRALKRRDAAGARKLMVQHTGHIVSVLTRHLGQHPELVEPDLTEAQDE